MKKIRYLAEYIIVSVLFILFKIIGYKNSSNFGAKIGRIFGLFVSCSFPYLTSFKFSRNRTENSQIIRINFSGF